VTTEGDAIIGTDQLRSGGCKGRGVKVGVISDGVDNRTAAQATNDLPSNITIQTHAGSGDEGTAILEIVHDLAPEARLGFCGPQTSVEMIQCVSDLANVFGAKIIVDNVSFFNEPFFEDGAVAQAVQNVLPNVVYASSAGNLAQGHYEGNYQTVSYQGADCHDFGRAAGGSSDATMNVLVSPGGFLLVVLQWNDLFGGSGNDYNLFILNDAEDTILTGSVDIQAGTDDPIEGAIYQNTSGSTVRVKVVINKYRGADRFMEMILYGNAQVEEYNVPEGSIFGHAAVPGVLATAAIAANDPGHDTIEYFSSRGPSRIFFPAPETRQKPDVTGIDGVSVTGAGGFPSPFYGTSASAAHVAGLAALLRPAYPTAAATVAAIKNGAIDLGAPGFDYTFGTGRISAQDYLGITCPRPAMPWIPLLLLDE
jgi:subtilisin family serine protease